MARASESIPDVSSPRDDAAGDSLAALLREARAVLAEGGCDFVSCRKEIEECAARLRTGRFHLAVLGQFKRGKSTLLNALLGERILPSAVVPLTAVPTFVSFRAEPGVTVAFEGKAERKTFESLSAEEAAEVLASFVTEKGNPGNEKGVAWVELGHPAPILAGGLVLVDTPGIGSTFKHNTEATLNFLPRCDAALFLLSPDPPVTEAEAAFLREVKKKVKRIFFILNKTDYLGEAERKEMVGFLEEVLAARAGMKEVRLVCVSARDGLAARLAGDEEGWRRSGMAAVEEFIRDFLVHDKAAVLQDALASKAADVLDRAVMQVELHVRGLRMPLEEVKRRLGEFDVKIREIREERVRVQDMIAGDRKRMHESLNEYAAALRERASAYLEGVLAEREARAHGAECGYAELAGAAAEAVPGFFEHELGRAEEVFGGKMRRVLGSHEERARRLAAAVRRAAADLFEIPYHEADAAGIFEMVRKPYWVKHKWSAGLGLLPPGLVERILPPSIRRARIRARIRAELEEVVLRNVENLRWATYQSVEHTFRRFSRTIDERLEETVAATRGAVAAAVKRRAEHASSTAEDLRRLDSLHRRMSALRDRLARAGGSEAGGDAA